METGFLSKNDSEYFSTDVSYDQSNEFESEGSLFQNFHDYTNDFDEYQWVISEDGNLIDASFAALPIETPQHDDFNQLKSLNDWDNNFSTPKVKEEDQNVFFNGRCSDIFPCSPTRQMSSPFDSHLDDPLNPNLLLDELPHVPTPFSPPPSTGPSFGCSSIKIKSEPKEVSDVEEIAEEMEITVKQEISGAAKYECDNKDTLTQSTAIASSKIKVEPNALSHFIKEEVEEVDVDVETVSDSTPVSEINDFTSYPGLSTSEKISSISLTKSRAVKHNRCSTSGAETTLRVPPLVIKKTNCQLKVESVPWPRKTPSVFSSPTESSTPVPKNSSANKTIIDSLPEEIIDRIKKSSSKKKKVVPVVPAERLPSKGNAHMKDAGLSKTKIREMVIKKQVKTEAAQIDHDYCTSDNGRRFEETNKVDGPQKPPSKPIVTVVVDAFSVTDEDKWVLDNEQKLSETLLSSAPTASPSPSEASSNTRNNWEKNSKRDSGLESGDVSDASESPSDKKCPPKPQTMDADNSTSVQIKVEKEDCYVNTPDSASNENCTQVPTESPDTKDDMTYEQHLNEPKKKKLNLDEYRSRRKFARLTSPVKTGTIGEAILSNKWVQRPANESDPAIKDEPIDEKIPTVPVQEPVLEVPAKPSEESKRKRDRSRERPRSRYRRRSSSSSSSGSRNRSSSARGRSKDKRRGRHWSRSRNRNVWSPSRSRSSSTHSRSSSGRSRSRSGSRSRSSRSSRYRGRSRSRSRSSYHRTSGSSNRRFSHHRFSNDRVPPRRMDDWSTMERQKQVEERRVIYVGLIEEGTTKAQLRERFQCFGPIVDISLHFRERGDNYGFVTFAYKGDAYKAVENGNNNPAEPRYDICFGGRRVFCKQRYADLDSMSPQMTYSPFHQSRSNESFDNLLRAAKEKLLRSQKNV